MSSYFLIPLIEITGPCVTPISNERTTTHIQCYYVITMESEIINLCYKKLVVAKITMAHASVFRKVSIGSETHNLLKE